MTSIHYFAYGSNMFTKRLQARCKSATVRCAAVIAGYRLAFSKKSRDGSGKATLVSDPISRVYGVVFDIAAAEAIELDRIEGRGKGYERIEGLAALTHPGGQAVTVTAYIAHDGFLDAVLQPYDWYLDLVVRGAQQHGLRDDYVAALHATATIADADADRRTRREALAILAGLEPPL